LRGGQQISKMCNVIFKWFIINLINPKAALKECNERHIVGKDVTPFVLAKLNEISKGVSLRANLVIVTVFKKASSFEF